MFYPLIVLEQINPTSLTLYWHDNQLKGRLKNPKATWFSCSRLFAIVNIYVLQNEVFLAEALPELVISEDDQNLRNL